MNKETRPTEPDARFDPDVRFLLANERTLLAWVRTAIALMAGGLVAAHLGEHITSWQRLFGIAAVLLGALMGVVGFLRFRAADKAIREARLPSVGYGPWIQLGLVIVIAAALAFIIATDVT
jgi:putative membrane protein